MLLCGLGAVLLLGYNQPKNGIGSASPSPTPSLWVRLDDEDFRKALVAEQLKPLLRGLDSLVVESVGSCITCVLTWLDKSLGNKVCFQVQYRAKNGFGGNNRTSAWIVYNGGGGWNVFK